MKFQEKFIFAILKKMCYQKLKNVFYILRRYGILYVALKNGGIRVNNDLLKIEIIKEYINKRKINWTKHCLNRLNQRNILISDIKKAINNGKIIEYYYDDYPYPSCLILGYTIENKILHIVCGINNEVVNIITAYYPDDSKWEDDMKTRRKK